MIREKKSIRLGSSWTVAEVIFWERLCLCIEGGFVSGEMRMMANSPLAKSGMRKFRSMAGSARAALAGTPRRAKRVRDREAASAQ